MRCEIRARLFAISACLCLSLAGRVAAEGAADESPNTMMRELEKLFEQGVTQRDEQSWGLALDAFERALTIAKSPRQIAAIQFNIAVCESSLGEYVSARRRWLVLMQQPELLDPDSLHDTERYLVATEKLIVRVEVKLEPETATLLVDEAPIIPSMEGANLYTSSPERGANVESLKQKRFTLLLDAGNHIFRAKRDGHADAVLNRTYGWGATDQLELVLALLPAKVSVTSQPPGAEVRLNERYQGFAPGDFAAPAGKYQLGLELKDYVDYKQELKLEPGQRLDLVIPLKLYDQPWYAKWWLWTAVGVVVAGAVVSTVLVTRPEPQTPPFDGGTSGWVAQAP
jgi:hypothetical protein